MSRALCMPVDNTNTSSSNETDSLDLANTIYNCISTTIELQEVDPNDTTYMDALLELLCANA